MDKLAAKFGHGDSSNTESSSSASQLDYGDKALNNLEEKYGGGMIDPENEKVRQINEKITDGLREKFEEKTGYDVPEKFSN
ncbi:hypothetical protein BDW42DRAFT_177622 [Aspergillus taichungensis]|uniref:Uncharacterized protein n=1 Tax=Aspergillus taichungensis TaxID=482145 RepID=A0A2J5HIV0_9EURO|nr:hypothetical protein BDW42DRAFT_177622 [Aspergillus taichungensis]